MVALTGIRVVLVAASVASLLPLACGTSITTVSGAGGEASTSRSSSASSTMTQDAATCGPTVDASDTAGCPNDRPNDGDPCSSPGLYCDDYGAISQQVTATCTSTCVWSLSYGPVFQGP